MLIKSCEGCGVFLAHKQTGQAKIFGCTVTRKYGYSLFSIPTFRQWRQITVAGVLSVPKYIKNAQRRGERILGRGRCVERESCRFRQNRWIQPPEMGAACHGGVGNTRDTDVPWIHP